MSFEVKFGLVLTGLVVLVAAGLGIAVSVRGAGGLLALVATPICVVWYAILTYKLIGP
jgi:hypothetical protein